MTSANTDHHAPKPEHDHAVAPPHHPIAYGKVFIALVGLTIITVVIATHRFEWEVTNVLLAILVAALKGSLVVLFFMHLKYEGKLIYLILLVPLFLSILLVMAMIPDVVLNHNDSDTASLHQFNPVHLVQSDKH